MALLQRVKGTRDFLPREMLERRYIEQKMRKVCKNFGYSEISTPIFEHADIFVKKSGEAIVKQMYTFKDKSGRKLALRPELTAPVMRFYIQELQALPKPLKLFYFGSCYRYEEPQRARYREFWHFGAEYIGGGRESEAEVIALAKELLEAAGVKNYILRIGHLGALKAILQIYKIPVSRQPLVLSLVDKKEFDYLREEVEDYEELIRVLTQGSAIFENQQLLRNVRIKNSLAELKALLDILPAFGVTENNYNIDLSIARGLAYYTGMVFEIDCKDLGAEKQLCGGGTYRLVEVLGGEKIATTGFAIGFDRVMLALELQGVKLPEEHVEIYVVPVDGNEVKRKAFELATKLRKSDFSCDIDTIGRSLAKNLTYADSIKASKVILLGENELAQNSVIIRDMATGMQEKVNVNKVVEYLKGAK
ncbi:MAG: histidine--tRNA ligase [Candidatus Thermoplasmatota archaeon]|nr:histidine--tRNA ligase [Candidatus Thermoplasmatota archaeon]